MLLTHTMCILLKFNTKKAKISREKFIQALQAELPPTILRDDSPTLLGQGYVKPIYLEPLYQEQICLGEYPFNLTNRDYKKESCPICEDMHYNRLITHEFMRPGMEQKDLDDVIGAFYKVVENLDEIRE